MRQLFSFFTMLGLMSLSVFSNAQNFEISPKHPAPGDEITIKYNPEGTDLEGMKFETTAYLMTADGPQAVEVLMTETETGFEGKVMTSEAANAVFFGFQNADKRKRDDRDGKGYKTLFYKDEKPVKGALLSKGNAYGNDYRTLGVKRDFDKALKCYKKELKNTPEMAHDNAFMGRFVYWSSRQKNEEGLAQCEKIAAEVAGKKTKTEDDYRLLGSLYKGLKANEKFGAIEAEYKAAFPDGKWKQSEMRTTFRNEKDLVKKGEIFAEYKTKYSEDESGKTNINYFARTLANSYAKENDWDNFSKYMSEITSATTKAGIFNGIAWDMAGDGLEGEAMDLEKAEKYSKKSLKLLKLNLEDPANKPAYLTEKQWKRNTKYSYGMYADTYALIKYKTEDYEDALKYQTKACKISKWEDAEMNERYGLYHEKAKGAEETEAVLGKLVAEGHANSKMKEQYKRLFLANNTVESAFDKHMASLEAAAMKKMKNELKKKLIEQPAPDFALVNLKGENVSLADMKGKVVILDFWATWCGPCKASFPGMQRTVDKFKDNENVEFLFVDTWERAADMHTNAANFIEKHSYTFNVLLDNENKVVSDYGVEGIPTKFIIGKEGKIRYRSSGFGGNDDDLVNELSILIDLLGGTEKADMTGAP